MFKLVRARERKTRDPGYVRCIKGEDGRVLVEETEIRERWRNYFSRLLNARVSLPKVGIEGFRRGI